MELISYCGQPRACNWSVTISARGGAAREGSKDCSKRLILSRNDTVLQKSRQITVKNQRMYRNTNSIPYSRYASDCFPYCEQVNSFVVVVLVEMTFTLKTTVPVPRKIRICAGSLLYPEDAILLQVRMLPTRTT